MHIPCTKHYYMWTQSFRKYAMELFYLSNTYEMGRGPQKDWPENKRTWCYDFVSKKSWKILHTALTWGQTIIMFPVRKQTVGCHMSWWLHSRNKCNTMVDNTGHRLLSAENRKAHPTIWCIPHVPRAYVEKQWNSSTIKSSLFLL